ncbi:Lipoprotein NlpI, contains TPR repeats [Escherichia coli P12b]|nr:Lipoprotein NlpI, contains TPR repeats [Escherichia coli P12b]
MLNTCARQIDETRSA